PSLKSPAPRLSSPFGPILIKEHNLQDPENKKIIKLKKIFAGKDQFGFLEIAGLITPHFLK
ncbi:hypothetical protein LINGRAHAP2_LOCUS24572, partial [Linum grandiflorum]